MALLPIYTFPDPVLRQAAKPVTVFDAELEKLAQDMLETMYDAPGVGLAANQVGVLKRIVVIDVDFGVEGDEEAGIRTLVDQNPRIIVNPVIVKKSGDVVSKEGCLSVPGFTEEVKRCSTVTLKYQDEKGKPHTLENVDGLLAICIQHEIDHIDGKLFIDRLSMVKRQLIKGKIKKERGTKFERSKFHVEL
jgi:peptide deformylase